MAGSFDLDNSLPPLASDALPVGVFRYDSENSDQPFSLLPNVRCLRIDVREGCEPPCARFEYIMDDSLALNFGWPSQFEQLWPIDAQGDYVVAADDRLVVMGQNPDGSPLYLFDGFAQIPQVDICPAQQRVSFAAVGVAARAYDDVITGRVQRHAGSPSDTSGASDVAVDLPCRFNPADTWVSGRGGFLGNSTPPANYTRDEGNILIEGGKGLGDFPVFIDPLLSEREDADSEDEDPSEGGTDAGDLVAPWYISDALKYLISQPNGGDDYLDWPTFSQLDALLQALYPPPGSNTFNPETAIAANIMIRDFDATNRPLPDVVAELLGYAGFLVTWQTAADANGLPQTNLKIYRRDAAATQAPKVVYLDQARNTVNPATSNVTSLHLARDCNAIVNEWSLETAQRQVEITVILAPLYQPQAGDENAPACDAFKQSNLTSATQTTRRKYRWYGADECGDGHWNSVDSRWSTAALDLSPVFPPQEDGSPSYVERYRPGSDTLITRDPQGRPLKATLEIYLSSTSPDTNPDPYIAEGQTAAAWYTIPNGWQLLDDRLGIQVTAPDPNQWSTGNPRIPGGGDIRIGWWSNPSAALADWNGGQPPVLRLTTVIEGDLQMGISANKRTASPTRFTRSRTADCRDHFHLDSVDPSSAYFSQAGGSGSTPVVVRDDREVAQTHANQLRAAHEMPPLAGSFTIPYVTTYYQIGDRIAAVQGRNVNLQTNIAANQGESPVYPWVVGISWDFSGERQRTVLYVTDRRAEVRNPW